MGTAPFWNATSVKPPTGNPLAGGGGLGGHRPLALPVSLLSPHAHYFPQAPPASRRHKHHPGRPMRDSGGPGLHDEAVVGPVEHGPDVEVEDVGAGSSECVGDGDRASPGIDKRGEADEGHEI